MDGLGCIWSLLHRGVKMKQENYERNRHSGISPTGDLSPYFLMNLCAFPQVVLNYSHQRLCSLVYVFDIHNLFLCQTLFPQGAGRTAYVLGRAGNSYGWYITWVGILSVGNGMRLMCDDVM